MTSALAHEIFWIQFYHLIAFTLVLAVNHQFYLRSRKNRILLRYLQVQLCLLVWIASKILKTISPDVDLRWLWIVTQYAGVAMLGPSFIHFATVYAGLKTPRLMYLSYAVGMVFFMVFVTNPLHLLYYSRYDFYGDSFGPAFYVHMGFTYALVLLGMVISALSFRKSRKRSNGSSIIALAALAPMVINVMYVTRLIRPLFDPTPIVMSLAILLFAYAALRYNFLGIVPIRAVDLIQALPDPIFVKDPKGRVVYSNFQDLNALGGYSCYSQSCHNGHSIEAYTDTTKLQELKDKYRTTMQELEATSVRLKETRLQRIALYRSRLRAETRRELHDLLGHGLTLVLLLLRSALIRKDSQPESAKTLLDTALDHACRSRLILKDRRFHETRADRQLRKTIPRTGFLSNALHTLGEAYQDSHLSLEIQCRGQELPLPNGLMHQLVRCVQEGLANAIKHADPTTIIIGLIFSPMSVCISIINDGTAPSDFCFGEGLTMMRDRIQEQGGSLHACADEARGFILSLMIPLPRELA
jgi:signal transduction histidine kinase